MVVMKVDSQAHLKAHSQADLMVVKMVDYLAPWKADPMVVWMVDQRADQKAATTMAD